MKRVCMYVSNSIGKDIVKSVPVCDYINMGDVDLKHQMLMS
jgi:hypothetical protein